MKVTEQEVEDGTEEKEDEWEQGNPNSDSEDSELECIEGQRNDRGAHLSHWKQEKEEADGKGKEMCTGKNPSSNHKTGEGYTTEASEISDASEKQTTGF